MSKRIIVDVSLNETRVAFLDNSELVEYYLERSKTDQLVGNIYRGKVKSVLPGMQAAFVDIGYEKNAFLYVGDAISQGNFGEIYDEDFHEMQGLSIEEILSVGQELTVQVIKEPIGTKGPRITTNITLPGRLLVLIPNVSYVGVSRRIADEDQREYLKDLVKKIKPANVGFIIRTIAEGKKTEDFEQDIHFLDHLWKTISNKEKSGAVPRCIHQDLGLVYRTIRDIFSRDIFKFVINNRREYQQVLDFVQMVSPALKSRVEYFSSTIDIFEHFEIESKLNVALSKKVWLKSGGYLIIEITEALTVIDVNTGKFVGNNNLEETVLKTNIEAAKEIAKQLRLRDIGGIIVIDFIDMVKVINQKEVIDTLKEALKKDRTKTTVVGMTGLGLIEMTRKKVRQSLDTAVFSKCHHCDGMGKVLSPETVARKVEKEIYRYFNASIAQAILVEVNQSVLNVLTDRTCHIIEQIEKQYHKKIIIEGNRDLKIDDIKIKEVDINLHI